MQHLKNKLLHSSAASSWKKIGFQRRYGINLILSALRTEKSSGIGEFLDLYPLIDWAQKQRFSIIQLLPLNDSGSDPSPYNALSSCALHPIYLSLHALPYLDELPKLQEKLVDFVPLNQTERVCYAQVSSYKYHWLHSYYELVGKKILDSENYKKFEATHPWLVSYSLFKVFKNRSEQMAWQHWPEDLRAPSEKERNAFIQTHLHEVQFYSCLQYLCYMQLKLVHDYAHSRSILLKGDIPILISADSADVWHEPHLFDLSLAAGAPPDQYNADGQYWGFPLFNWRAMEENEGQWWKERLSCASQFYDIYRIDHLVGFFRIWGIPLGEKALNGFFVPEEETKWLPEGKKRLLMLLQQEPGLLPIAEDLGSVPQFVRQCIKELGVPGTKVMRWERLWDEDKSFIPYKFYEPISMTCVSTHDSPTLALWWQTYKEEAIDFAAFEHWEMQETLSYAMRQQILKQSHRTASLFSINLLQEYLALFPELVAENPEDEQINRPGVISEKNWTYRFRPSVEEIVQHEGLKSALQDIIP